MARLIDADAAKIRFANYREDCINEDDINAANVFADVVSELDEFPTIDPVTAAAEALGMSPDRLRELAQAEKEGRLVVLPCEIGSPVYSHARKLDGADYVRETEFWWSGFNEPGFGLRPDRLGVDTGFGCRCQIW